MEKRYQCKDIPDLAVLKAAEEFSRTHETLTFDRLCEQFPHIPPKVIWTKLANLDYRGLLDYGVSLRGAWLTDKGIEMLRELEGGT